MARSSDSAAVLDIRRGIVSHRLEMRSYFLLACLMAAGQLQAQTADAGRAQFDGHCAVCHGKGGNGGELGPAIVHAPAQLQRWRTRHPPPHRPAQLRHAGRSISTTARPASLISFLRTLKPSGDEAVPVRAKVALGGGRTLEGLVFNRSSVDMQLLTGRSAHPPAAQGWRGLPRSHQPDGLAHLSRPVQREPLQRARRRFRRAMWRGWRPSGSSRWSTPLRSK